MNEEKIKAFLEAIPKTTIATILSSIIVYSLGKGWIGQLDAELLSNILVALGLGINMYSGKLNMKQQGNEIVDENKQ